MVAAMKYMIFIILLSPLIANSTVINSGVNINSSLVSIEYSPLSGDAERETLSALGMSFDYVDQFSFSFITSIDNDHYYDYKMEFSTSYAGVNQPLLWQYFIAYRVYKYQGVNYSISSGMLPVGIRFLIPFSKAKLQVGYSVNLFEAYSPIELSPTDYYNLSIGLNHKISDKILVDYGYEISNRKYEDVSFFYSDFGSIKEQKYSASIKYLF